MKRTNSIFNHEPMMNYTAWELVIFGEDTYSGVDPKTAVIISRLCKLCSNVFNTSERQNDYWKKHVFNEFKSYENDYKFKVDVVWKKLFCDYSNEQKKRQLSKNILIEMIANHCSLMVKSKDSSIDRAELYYILEPIRGILLQPDANSVAQYYLALCYANGYGTPKNKAEAFKYYKLSADQGNASAQCNLGICYDRGTYVARDLWQATMYYKLSADQGNATAGCNLAKCYKLGQGITSDPEMAFKYYKLSAKQKNAEAQSSLALCYADGYGTDQNQDKAFKYYKLAADQGYAFAQCKLGFLYYHGHHIDKNPLQAFKYYKLSARQGIADAQYSLYLCYSNGYGVNQDSSKALKYCKLAADQGHAQAIEKLAELP